MKNAKFIGNCSTINWKNLIEDLKKQNPEIRPKQLFREQYPDFAYMWENAGYRLKSDGGNVEWQMFYPDQHFDQKIVDEFCKFSQIEEYSSVWISRIMPGYCAPRHYDILVNRVKNLRRIHCHISPPEPGHIFILNDEHFYNQLPGNTYEWNNPDEWHVGINCDLNPKYILNIY